MNLEYILQNLMEFKLQNRVGLIFHILLVFSCVVVIDVHCYNNIIII